MDLKIMDPQDRRFCGRAIVEPPRIPAWRPSVSSQGQGPRSEPSGISAAKTH